jgi:ribosomal protein S18 acetylase RimI-like enzyme/ADP-ribose pyrophosphatase YjhB (NUDIX family)
MIRVVRAEDAASLAAIDLRVVQAVHGVVRSADQADDEAGYHRRILGMLDGPPGQRAMWVADVDGAVVGEATVTRYGVAFCRHVASLALQVDPAWQGRGIGRELMSTLVAWGTTHRVERMQLSVIGDNHRAIALYTSFGFVIDGRRRRFLVRPDGSRTDDVIMARLEGRCAVAKAAAIVVREPGEMLILVHPDAGWQIPKGTLEDGEAPEDAVLREVEEETGLTGLRDVRSLGAWTQVTPSGDLQRWHGFVVGAPEGTPDRWEHAATGSPEEEGLVFTFRWAPLTEWALEVLPPQFHELVRRAMAAPR